MKLGQTDIYWGSRVPPSPPPMAQGAACQPPDDATLDALIVVPLAIVSGLALLVAGFVGAALVVGLFLRIVLSVL